MRINYRVSNSGKIGKVLLIIIGSIFLFTGIGEILLGFFFLQSGEKTDEYVKIKAVISEIVVTRDSDGDTEYDVFVDYTYDGVKYSKRPYNLYTSSMYEGKKIDILCDPNNPENITFEGGQLLPSMILFFLGGVFSIVSIIILIVGIRARKNSDVNKKKLENKGKRVSATVEKIIIDESSSVNGNIAYRIVCVYQDIEDNVIYRYKSDVLFEDPSGFYYSGVPIDVYINPDDPSEYHVVVENMKITRIVDYV